MIQRDTCSNFAACTRWIAVNAGNTAETSNRSLRMERHGSSSSAIKLNNQMANDPCFSTNAEACLSNLKDANRFGDAKKPKQDCWASTWPTDARSLAFCDKFSFELVPVRHCITGTTNSPWLPYRLTKRFRRAETAPCWT